MKYRVSVEFKGKLGYIVDADSKEAASSDVALKFIERDIKNSNLNELSLGSYNDYSNHSC